MVVLCIVAIGLTCLIGYRASMSGQHLFTLGFGALFAGFLFESFRIADHWTDVIDKFIGTYAVSLLAFLPGKREHGYDLDTHIAIWPYFFIGAFAIATTIFDNDKITAKLTEGITLLLSLSMIYWVLDYGIMDVTNWFRITLLVIVLFFSGYSILNAFTALGLSGANRLILSIWSTIVVVAFATDNILKVFQSNIESSKYLSEGVMIGIQYFLLGVSGVYITQNVLLLVRFLPDKNSNYRTKVSDNIADHLLRYSEDQVHIGSSLFCFGYCAVLFGLNFTFHFLPRHTMIWLVVFTFPVVLSLIHRLTGQKQ